MDHIKRRIPSAQKRDKNLLVDLSKRLLLSFPLCSRLLLKKLLLRSKLLGKQAALKPISDEGDEASTNDRSGGAANNQPASAGKQPVKRIK